MCNNNNISNVLMLTYLNLNTITDAGQTGLTGSGDWETLYNLHKENPGRICPKPVEACRRQCDLYLSTV